jgi:hypothetical protein
MLGENGLKMNKKKLIKIKSDTMKKSWKLGLIKSHPRGIEKNPLKKGNKFNHLTIIKFHHKVWKYNRTIYYYLCKCDCGKERITAKEWILNGDVKSCGCYRYKLSGIKHRKDKYYASAKGIYELKKANAKRRNIIFDLTFNEFINISSQKCYFCGNHPNYFIKSHKEKYYGIFKYNGLDRINNHKGYTTNNVVPCCKYCNYAKNDLSITKFLNHIKKIYEYITKK